MSRTFIIKIIYKEVKSIMVVYKQKSEENDSATAIKLRIDNGDIEGVDLLRLSI